MNLCPVSDHSLENVNSYTIFSLSYSVLSYFTDEKKIILQLSNLEINVLQHLPLSGDMRRRMLIIIKSQYFRITFNIPIQQVYQLKIIPHFDVHFKFWKIIIKIVRLFWVLLRSRKCKISSILSPQIYMGL